MNSSDLAQQLNLYIIELIKIEQLITKQEHAQHHLQVLKQKITMKISQFKMVTQQLTIQNYSPSVVAQMNSFFKQSFTLIIKEAHRLIQVRSNPQSHSRLKGKMSLIKEMEDQMGSIWEQQKQRKAGVLKKLNQNISTFSQQLDQTQLKSIAKNYLHKQFLAIRMIAYRLYEQYMGHSHSKIKQQLQEIKQTQQQLIKQAEQLKQLNKDLNSEQKRLIRQLNQLKKVNDLIGKRYFVTEQESPKY